jgi:hypothetical protein
MRGRNWYDEASQGEKYQFPPNEEKFNQGVSQQTQDEKKSSPTFFRAFCNFTMSTSDHEEDFADLFGVSQCFIWMSEKVGNSMLIESIRDQTMKKSSSQSILFKSFNDNQSLSSKVWYLCICNRSVVSRRLIKEQSKARLPN